MIYIIIVYRFFIQTGRVLHPRVTLREEGDFLFLALGNLREET